MPQQQKTPFQRLPWSTLILCTALLLGFAGQQNIGLQQHQFALNHYLNTGLFTQEKPLYLAYQSRQYRVQQSVAKDSLILLRQRLQGSGARDYAWLLMQDRHFVHYLENQGARLMPPLDFERWRSDRQAFQQNLLANTWDQRFGITPETPSPATFISYLFVPQYWAPLLLSLLLLLLFAPFIERRLGHAALPLWFFISGSLYAGLYCLTASTEGSVLLGASGAISGLIGVTIGIIIINVRSPVSKTITIGAALALLAVKLLLERWLEPLNASLIICHAANLALCCAIFIMLFAPSRKQSNQSRKPAPNNAVEVRQGLHDAFQNLDQYDFAGAALRVDQLKKTFPNNVRVAKHAYLIAKLNPQSERFNDQLDDYIANILLHDDYNSARCLLAELIKLGQQAPLKAQRLPSLIRLFVSHNDLKKAEHSFKLYARSHAPAALINEAQGFLFQEFEKRKLYSKMSQYRPINTHR